MSHIKLLFLATRPAFLSITALGFFIGLASQGTFKLNVPIVFGLFLALLGHAAANVINDYFDALNGTDAINSRRISPFTGGSRFIQNNIFTKDEIKRLSLGIFFFTMAAGLWLAYETTWHLLWIGALGLFLGWSYSAPPLQLMSRGILGECAIVLSWALIVVGASFIQEHRFASSSIYLGLAYGFMVSSILFINQIPDIEADRLSKKFTLAVNHRNSELWIIYASIHLLAYGIILLGIFLHQLSTFYWICFGTIPLSVLTIHFLRLELISTISKTIKLTLVTTHLFGLLLFSSSFWS